MDCLKFQDTVSDYLEGVLDSRNRAECAAHRLICRDCRELYNDVRATMQTLSAFAAQELEEPYGLEDRILAATTAGAMLNCGEFDKLLERYFDGVILAPTFQTFQAHFEKCSKCRRLIVGIEDAIEMCHEVKQAEVEVPASLHDRIVAATIGAKPLSLFDRLQASLLKLTIPLRTPQIAVAALIFAASCTLILSRFGSFGEMAKQTGEQGKRALNNTGTMARNGWMIFGNAFDARVPTPTPFPVIPVTPVHNVSVLPSPTPTVPLVTVGSQSRKQRRSNQKNNQQ